MSKKWLRGSLGVILIGAAMFATLGEGESTGDGDSGGDKTEESTAPASSQQNPIPLGTDVEVAADWNVKVNSAELDANATVATANQFNTPQPGNQFVIVNVSITNNSDQPAEVFTNVKLSLLPPSGIAADTAFVAGVPGEIDPIAQMQPGATATGNLVFEVPAAEAATSVLLGQSVFTMDEAKDQKFFAIQ
jgi:hypothetical protein